MTIVVNGERREVPDSLTVAGLLRDLGVKPEFVAVEVNRDLVPRVRHDRTAIAPDDVLEVVTLVGGGAPAGLESEPIVIGPDFDDPLPEFEDL